MTLESAYFIAQIVAGIAVVFSLLYVAMQITQNTRAVKMAAAQNLQSIFGRIEELMIMDAAFSDLVLRAARGEDLPATDRWRMTLMARHVLRTWQTAHYFYRRAVLDRALWQPQAEKVNFRGVPESEGNVTA